MKFRFLFLVVAVSCFSFEHQVDQGLLEKKFLVFGGETGWIGKKVVSLLEARPHSTVVIAKVRIENREEVERELVSVHPDYIINAAGVTGRPNVDWCEDNKQQTVRTNVIGTLNLIDLAYIHGIHLTNFSSGCIYQYDSDHPIGSAIGFTEEDEPNFSGSFYSKMKGLSEKIIRYYPNVLNLRLRMPITADSHPKNFITKITRYQKVIDVPNSMTVLEDLLPVAVEMTLMGLKGTYNFTNPGAISHNEVLQLYREYIDPNFTWENFSIDEQNQVLKAERSNNELDVSKLLEVFPNVPPIKESLPRVFEKMRSIKN